MAEDHNDKNLADLLDKMLEEQAESIKAASVVVSELRRVGKGLGVFAVDRYLADKDKGDVLGGGNGAA